MQSGAIPIRLFARPPARSFVPGVAIAAGLASRYRYWRGRSGRAYLFTRVERRSLCDFHDALALTAKGGCVVWVGEAAEFGGTRAGAGQDADVACYVHLLAPTRDRRGLIARDLGGCAVAVGDCPSSVRRVRSAA